MKTLTTRTTHLVKHICSVSVALAAAVVLQGCATTAAGSKNEQALVCPQCKMVEASVYQAEIAQKTSTYEHQCPGCKGALMSFLHEGKWEHKCSICKQRPFTCPVVHPTA